MTGWYVVTDRAECDACGRRVQRDEGIYHDADTPDGVLRRLCVECAP